MSDEIDWNFVDKDDAKAEIRAAVEYLLRGTTGGIRGDIVQRSLRSFATPRTDNLGGPIRWTMTCPAVEPGAPTYRLVIAPGSRALLYNFKAVGGQFQNYGLGDVRALFRLHPLVV